MKSYVLISPARNEADYIKKTLNSVVKQTVLPKLWVIISDGSTDKTNEIVSGYAEKYSFIKFLKTSGNNGRNFGSKVDAFNFGLNNVGEIDYDFIGNLDGDIGMESDYYEKILCKFDENPRLGIAGGVRLDYLDGKFITVKSARNSVAGGFQLFRKECFNKIGGYRALRYGGIDAVAETMTRMYGWEVESFEDIKLYHYKPTGSAHKNIFKSKFRVGIKFYLVA
jgi:biofilm PGA synthesis N-glycosyltransferase PgaC